MNIPRIVGRLCNYVDNKFFPHHIYSSTKITLKPLPVMWFENEKGDKISFMYEGKPPTEEMPDIKDYPYAHMRMNAIIRDDIFKRDKTGDDGDNIIGSRQRGFNGDLALSLANNSNLKLSEAIAFCATCCERCMNLLANKLGLSWGYTPDSEDAKKVNTSCEVCPQVAELFPKDSIKYSIEKASTLDIDTQLDFKRYYHTANIDWSYYAEDEIARIVAKFLPYDIKLTSNLKDSIHTFINKCQKENWFEVQAKESYRYLINSAILNLISSLKSNSKQPKILLIKAKIYPLYSNEANLFIPKEMPLSRYQHDILATILNKNVKEITPKMLKYIN